MDGAGEREYSGERAAREDLGLGEQVEGREGDAERERKARQELDAIKARESGETGEPAKTAPQEASDAEPVFPGSEDIELDMDRRRQKLGLPPGTSNHEVIRAEIQRVVDDLRQTAPPGPNGQPIEPRPSHPDPNSPLLRARGAEQAPDQAETDQPEDAHHEA